MSTVLIRQIPDDYADTTGLAKYNRSRMPGCKDIFVAAELNSRFLTGIDEDAFFVKKEEKEEIKTLRESLQKSMGKDLSGLSDYWRTYAVVIRSDNPKTFNTDIPDDIVALKMLTANGYVAPSKEAAFTPQYREAQYYAYTEETEDAEELSSRTKRDAAISKLVTIAENKDRMLLYGQYLEGLKYTTSLSVGTLYKMLRAYIEDKDIKNAANFLMVFDQPVEKLQQKIIIDKALKQRLINRVSVGGKKYVYQYGQVTIGATVEEVYKNLSLPDFAPELRAINQELTAKK